MSNLTLTKQDLRDIVNNNGYNSDGVYFSIADAVSTPDTPLTLGQVYTEVLQSLIEMQSVGTRLVQTIRHDDVIGESTTFKWYGAGNIPNVERAENGEYPEFTLAVGQSSTIRAQFLQRGLEVRISAENIRYSRWDLIRAHIMQAGLALLRAKEALIFSTFEGMGVTIFDNNDPMTGGNPAVSLKGPGTGRDRYGVKNGSLTYEDYIDMQAAMIANGYTPNVMLVHPSALPIFQKDPVMRHIGIVNGNPQAWLASGKLTTNSYKNATVDTWRQQQRKANGNSQTLTDREVELLSTQGPELPSFHPMNGMTIIVSPQVPFDPVAKTTSIILLDTSASAILNEQSPITVDEWEVMSREIHVVRIKEAYSVDVIDEGRGIAVAKNIPLVPNEIFNDPQVVINDLTP